MTRGPIGKLPGVTDAPIGRGRHDLDAGGDHDVVGAGDDALGGEVRRPAGTSRTGGRSSWPGTDSGQPAASTALRPTLMAWLPTCMTQPMITSSTSGGIEVVALGRGLEHLGREVGRVPA